MKASAMHEFASLVLETAGVIAAAAMAVLVALAFLTMFAGLVVIGVHVITMIIAGT